MCTNYQINQIVYDGSVLYAENVLLNNSRLKGKCYGFIIIYYLHCCDCRLAIWQWTSVKLTTIFTYCVDARWIYCLMLCFNLSSRFSSEFRKKKHKLDSTSTSLLSYQNIIYFCFFFFSILSDKVQMWKSTGPHFKCPRKTFPFIVLATANAGSLPTETTFNSKLLWTDLSLVTGNFCTFFFLVANEIKLNENDCFICTWSWAHAGHKYWNGDAEEPRATTEKSPVHTTVQHIQLTEHSHELVLKFNVI